mmetsp:Transcript_12313/g.36816  ORF Transcript_12313/g.36816 Transcript_12313/m.36816 type:complete len:424 (-) Transcript_12313:585-1856(-)
MARQGEATAVAHTDHHAPAPLHARATDAHHPPRHEVPQRMQGRRGWRQALHPRHRPGTGGLSVKATRYTSVSTAKSTAPLGRCGGLRRARARRLPGGLGELALALEREEGACHHLKGVRGLHGQELEHCVVAQLERTGERLGRTTHDTLEGEGLNVPGVAHHDHVTLRVEAAAAGAAGHLRVLAGTGHAVRLPVPLAHGGEDHGAGGHINAHGKGLSGEEQANVALLEEELHHLLEQGQEARVVQAHAASQQGQHPRHLGQRLVLLGELSHGRSKHCVHGRSARCLLLLLLAGVTSAQRAARDRLRCKRLALLPREGEDDGREQVALPQRGHDAGHVRLVRAALARATRCPFGRVARAGHGALEVGMVKGLVRTCDAEEALGTRRVNVVVQRCGPRERAHHVAGLAVHRCHPLRKLCGVWDGR